MHAMYRFITSLIALAALLIFAGWARSHGAAVFVPLFDLVDGDPERLRQVCAAALAVFFAGLWLWSAKRGPPPRRG